MRTPHLLPALALLALAGPAASRCRERRGGCSDSRTRAQGEIVLAGACHLSRRTVGGPYGLGAGVDGDGVDGDDGRTVMRTGPLLMILPAATSYSK